MSFNRSSSLTILRLYCSLSLRPEYKNFRTSLEKYLPHLGRPTLPTTDDKNIYAALEVLQTEREKGNCDGVVSDINASTTDQGKPMIEADRPQTPVDNALKILVRNATEEFGFAPRDVYTAVFDLPGTMAQHNKVQQLRCAELASLVATFPWIHEHHELSHLVVAVWPHEHPKTEALDLWDIDFKSTRIAEKVMKSVVSEGYEQPLDIFSPLNRILEGSTMAGRFFEMAVHHIFAHGWKLDPEPIPQPIWMASDKADPPTFSTGTPTPGISPSSCAALRANARATTRVDLAHELSNVTLDEGKYYILTSTTNSLFDSFTVDLVDSQTAVISVFRIAISQNHGGSADGYLVIHEFITHVRKLLEEELLEREPPKKRHSRQKRLSVTVAVEYFLVCSHKGDGEWRMPNGWSEDLRGKVFRIRVPT
jgi:hypothetical protein